MAKGGGFLTPKAIGNRIKSKGLQRLRWYCQMCEKQCRDENGFRNHMSSESHLRQMRVFADNPSRYLSEFSRDFERGFLDILNHRHGTKRVKANQIYQEYIADKNHVHMNSTSWTSLAGFVQYLGKEGKIIAEDTEKGWYIQFIDRDPKLLAKQQQSQDREQAELDEEERQQMLIEAQIAAAASLSASHSVDGDDTAIDHALQPEHTKVAISFSSNKRPRLESSSSSSKILKLDSLPGFSSKIDSHTTTSSSSSKQASTSTIDQLMREEEDRKQHHIKQLDTSNRRDYWLEVGIVVRVINRDISNSKGSSLHNMKGVVIRVVGRYGGDVELYDGTIVRLDQQDVETIIPKVGGQVLVVNGAARGAKATLLKINESEYNCDLKVDEGPLENMEMKVAYEDFSKLATSV